MPVCGDGDHAARIGDGVEILGGCLSIRGADTRPGLVMIVILTTAVAWSEAGEAPPTLVLAMRDVKRRSGLAGAAGAVGRQVQS